MFLRRYMSNAPIIQELGTIAIPYLGQLAAACSQLARGPRPRGVHTLIVIQSHIFERRADCACAFNILWDLMIKTSVVHVGEVGVAFQVATG